MSKPTITRLFLGSLAAIVAGCVLGFLAVLVAYAGGAFLMDGPDVAGIAPTPFGAVMLVILLGSLTSVVLGGLAGLASWIGALLLTARIDARAWFRVLLALGVWNFGVVAMLVYVLAGPGGTATERTRPTATGGVAW